MKKTVSIILILLLSLPLFSCDKKYTDYSFESFDTVTVITGTDSSKLEFDKKCNEIKSLLYEYHRLYDIYNSYDGIVNLYTINQNTGVTHTVDSRITDLLLFCKQMYELTGGKVNVAFGNVLEIWHDYREKGESVPDKALLEYANQHTDIANLVIKDNTVTLTDKYMSLDVGAVAKGYAVERISNWMEQNGCDGYILNVGGNVRVIGDKEFKAGIEDPDGIKPYVTTLTISDASIVTSGSYQRYYTVDGKNYHHIIDTDTLYPAEYFKSVSVVCYDSGLADALSTALFCMPYEDGLALVNSLDNVDAIWITNDNTHYCTDGIKK